VALTRVLKDLEDLDSRQRRLEAAALEFVGVGHWRCIAGWTVWEHKNRGR
jgi:hypothetical protein